MLGDIPDKSIQDMTPTEYKTFLNKKIKEMDKDERVHYNNLRVRLHRKNKKKEDYVKYKHFKKQ